MAHHPLGPARFEERELSRFGGERYAPIELLAERLAARIRFDEADFALRIELSWDPAPQPGRSPDQPVRPDARPKELSLSALRGEIRLEQVDGEQSDSGFLAVSGGLGPGSYHARLERDPSGRSRLRDWQWSYREERRGLLLGHQFLAVHPLLSGFDFSGVQAAFVEGAPDLLRPADPLRLLDDGQAAVQNIRGEGPPGGIAELRLDGRTVARQRIPLDGRFEFLDVRLPPGYVRIASAALRALRGGAPAAVLRSQWHGQPQAAAGRGLPAAWRCRRGGQPLRFSARHWRGRLFLARPQGFRRAADAGGAAPPRAQRQSLRSAR